MDLSALRHVHCIGIGGVGISGVAKFLHASGVSVSGSDAKQSSITDGCSAIGISVSLSHDALNVPSETDLVVYTEAASKDNVERVEATKRSIPQMGHFDFLGELSKTYRTICVTGTNGKSTTTAMVGKIFTDAGLDPTVFVGSFVPGWELGNVRVGASDILIIEGDEYKRKMVKLHPETTVITNIELDHTDIYKDLADVERAFRQLGEQTSDHLVISTEVWSRDIFCGLLTTMYDSEFVRDGFHKDALRHRERRFEHGTQILDIYGKKSWLRKAPILASITLRIPGEFNMMNALAAKAVAECYDISLKTIVDSLASFTGIWRRFERVGVFHGAEVISDYGHHPTAVFGTLAGVREFFPSSRIVLLFEPHQHNRTKELFQEFAQSFGGADVLILSEIYGVLGRTDDADASVSSKTLLEAALQSPCPPKEGHYASNLREAEAMLREMILDGDVVVVMGAGDVDTVARNLVSTPS